MLSLTAKATHLDGQHSDVVGQFTAVGGSIGRDAKCDMALPDPDRRISRLQAQIVYIEGQYAVRNASTSNPMYVNGAELSPGSRQVICSGDELRAGSYVITVTGLTDDEQAFGSTSIDAALNQGPPGETAQMQTSQAGLGPDDPLRALGSGGPHVAAGANPFADLLPEAAPVPGGASNVSIKPKPDGADSPTTSAAGEITASNLSVNTPLQSHHNLGVAAAPGSLAGARQTLDAAAHQPVPTLDSFESPQAQKSGAGDQSSKDWAQPLSALAGDPFADLMGPPVETHIARVPVPGNGHVSQKTPYIPDDFNLLAAGGVAQRNSSDPLAALGRNARGLDDVMPERTIDSIYAPGAESPSTLTVDPLNQAQERALRIEQSMDPMTLFSDEAQKKGMSALLGDNNRADNTKNSVSNHASEMVSYFRAPTAKFDPALQGAVEQASNHDTSDVPAQSPVTQQAPVTQPAVTQIPITQTPVNASPQQILAQAADLPAQAAAASRPVLDVNHLQRSHSVLPVSTGSMVQRLMNPALSGARQNLNTAAASAEKISDKAPPHADTAHQVAQPPAASRDPHDGNTQILLSAFKQGAGLEDWPEQSLTPELMESMGRMLQAVTQGMVSLLATRATIKQEIHLSVTLINPKANNPLKFLPDGHTALLQMLGPRIPGFMAPVDAIEEAFEDLITHQTAIAAGTQAAIKALFQRFDPDAIAFQNPQNGMGAKISHTVHDARLWNIYRNQYKLISDEVRDDFFNRLGSDFHEAYNREYGGSVSDRE